MKHRFYSVSKVLVQARELKSHPLYNYSYDPEYEKVRKFELEKYLMRNQDKNEEEKKLMEELKTLEQKIKREEKE